MAAWQFTLAGKEIRLDDIGIDEVEAALEGTGVNWYDFERRPFDSAKALVAFVKHLCTDLGIDAPDRLTPARLAEILKLVDDDLPEVYENGLPDPKAGVPTTG